MGTSTDGILVFGIQIDDEEDNTLPEAWQKDDFEFDEFVRELAGIEEWENRTGEDYWDRVRKAKDECPADLMIHCSYDYPMYILAVRGTEISASRGYPAEIDPSNFVVSKEKIEAFKVFCIENKVEYSEPKWLLCSMRG